MAKRGKSKKAVSHIEMGISFGLFIIFVFFLIFYLNPVRHQNIINVLLDVAQQGMEERTISELVEMSLIIKTPTGDCLKVKNPFASTDRQKILVKDATGNIGYEIIDEGKNLTIRKTGNLYTLYYSEDETFLPPTMTDGCTELADRDYTFALPLIYKIYSLRKLNETKTLYDTDYSALKRDIKFPINSDFSIEIVNMATREKIIEMKQSRSEHVEVNVREIPIKILQDSGTLDGILRIAVW